MNKAILIGAGGHAKVVADVVLAEGRSRLIGCIAGTLEEKGVLGLPVLGTDKDLEKLFSDGIRVAYLGIGNNQIRKRIFEVLQNIGFEMPGAINPYSYLSSSVRIGIGSVVMAGAVIQPETVIGNGVIINTGASVDHDGQISDFVHIAPGSHLAGNVIIEEGVLLGIGTTVIPGCRVGAWSTVGAGSVIVRDIPSKVTAIGVPCKVR